MCMRITNSFMRKKNENFKCWYIKHLKFSKQLKFFSIINPSDSEVLFVCLFFVPLENFFTHLETSPLPMKSCKFWPMLGTLGHWAVRVLWRATHIVTRGICLLWSSPKTRATRACCQAFGNGAVTTCVLKTSVCRDWDLNTQLSAFGENALTHCATAAANCNNMPLPS